MNSASTQSQKDLIVLVADKNMDATLRGILSRPKALGIRTLSFDIYAHPHHDPGCRTSSHSFLQAFSQKYHYSIVMFDQEGCGQENCSAEELEAEVESLLFSNGWTHCASTIVVHPELETWAWRKSPHLSQALGWENNLDELYEWLRENKYLAKNETSPKRPKEALEAVLRTVHKPRSSSIYSELATKLSLANCSDRAFLKLRSSLQLWFPE